MKAPRDYKDFYDLFGLPTEAEKAEIKERATDMMQKFHPDKADDMIAASPAQFKTMKIGRDILLDDDKRSEYDDIGHVEYVEKHHKGDIKGFTFTGRKSIADAEINQPDEEDVDELMQNDYGKVGDVTEEQRLVEDPETVQKRKEEKKRRIEEKRKANTPFFIKAMIAIGGFLNNPKLRFSIMMLVLGWFYWTLYMNFHVVATIFAVLLTVAFAYHPKVRVLFTAPFEK